MVSESTILPVEFDDEEEEVISVLDVVVELLDELLLLEPDIK